MKNILKMTMQRYSLLTLALMSLVLPAEMGAQSTNEPVLWTFGGINTTLPGYTGVHNPGIAADNTIGIPMADQVAYVTSKLGFTPTEAPSFQNQVILAHSQGGLRALAFARGLVNTAKAQRRNNPSLPAPQDYLRGVITINSPVQGYFPLAQGRAAIRDKLTKHSTTVSEGLSALKEAFGTDIPSIIASKAGMNKAARSHLEELLKDPTLMADAAIGRLLAPGVENAVPDPNSALDMARGSSWYQQNISAPGTWKLRMGANMFSWYWIYIPPKGLIPPEVRIAYIYGDNSDFDHFAASAIPGLDRSQQFTLPTLEQLTTFQNLPPWYMVKLAREATGTAGSLAEVVLDGVAEALDIRDAAEEALDDVTFWDNTYHGEFGGDAKAKRAQARGAEALAHFALHIDEVMADSLGTPTHDGFIPVTDQYDAAIGTTDSGTLGGSPIDLNRKAVLAKTGHLDALYHPALWGTEGVAAVGFDNGRVGGSGLVRDYLRALGLPQSLDALRADWNTVKP